MHALPLFHPTPCMHSPYSIPPHACFPLILSQPMHDFPLFYPTSCMPSPYSVLAHAWPPPILSQPMHILSLFSPSSHMPPHYSVPAHACPPNSLSHTPWRHVFSFEICICHFWIWSHWVYHHHHHHLPCLAIWSITLSLYDIECLLFSFTWTHHMYYTLDPILNYIYIT